jgi:hypothetical protein
MQAGKLKIHYISRPGRSIPIILATDFTGLTADSFDKLRTR